MDQIKAMDKLRARMVIRSEQLRDRAVELSVSDISKTTATAATAILRQTLKNEGRGGLGEPAQDLLAVRNDPKLNQALVNDLRIAREQAKLLIIGALATAYRDQVEGTPINGITLSVEFDSETKKALSNYPILGESAEEHAIALVDKLRREIYKLITVPGFADVNAEDIIARLSKMSTDHAQRLGSIVEEAYYAGAQAGFIDAAKTLTGAA
jgi:hypothetical protein